MVRPTEMIRPVKVDHLQSWSPKFWSDQTEMVRSIWYTNRNVRNFGLNGKRPWLHGLVLSCSMTTRLFCEAAACFIGHYDVARKNGSESVPWKQTHSAIRHNTDPVPSTYSKRAKRTEVTYSEIRIRQWPLCVFTSNEQISPPSLVCEQNSLHLLSLCTRVLFK